MSHASTFAPLALLAVVSASCANKINYTPPAADAPAPPNVLVVTAPFDEVWSGLIERVGSQFFAIDNFEKESGLLTLSFTASPMSSVVDGGHIEVNYDNSFAAGMGNYRPTVLKFNGPYTTYIEQYHRAQLNGRVNLVVRSVDASTTKVTVNTRYAIKTDAGTITLHSGERVHGSFKAGGRTKSCAFQPTGVVEQKILSALDEISEDP